MANLFRALIMGPPGSGKGTISSRIVRDFKFSYVSSGDVLREQISKRTKNGLIAKTYIDKGKLVPDQLVTSLVLELLQKYSEDNWLLDGFPRTVKQAKDLEAKYTVSLAINLIVPDEIIVSRLKGRWLHPGSGRIYNTDFNPPKIFAKDDVTGEDLIQRADDRPQVVQARLADFRKMNSSVIDYFRQRNVLKQFVGTETNEIWPRVKEYLLKELEQKKFSDIM